MLMYCTAFDFAVAATLTVKLIPMTSFGVAMATEGVQYAWKKLHNYVNLHSLPVQGRNYISLPHVYD